MAFRLNTNKKNGPATVIFTTSDTLTVAGGVGTSDLAIDDEILTGATISRAWTGCADGGSWTIKRGANTVFVISTTSFVDFAGNGTSIVLDSDADIVVEFDGTGEATLMLELKKIGRGSTEY